MSIEQLSDWKEGDAPRQQLATVLAKAVLESEVSLWRPDFLSRELAEEIAAEIGPHATVVPTYFKNVRSEKGSSYALELGIPDNIVMLQRD